MLFILYIYYKTALVSYSLREETKKMYKKIVKIAMAHGRYVVELLEAR